MNDDANPPQPPQRLPGSEPPSGPPLAGGAGAADGVAVKGIGAAIEFLLREPRRLARALGQPGGGRLAGLLLAVAVVSTAAYGAVVGSFSGGVQWWAAPLKITAGLFLSAAICLPSLYIFSCLAGSTARWVDVARLVAGLVTLMAVLLIGFAPVAWVFSQSTESVVAMGVLHLGFWLMASWFGFRFLDRAFEEWSKAAGGFRLWMVLFAVVMLQMTAALRPLVGSADTLLPQEKKFFVAHWMDVLEGKRP
jgi:hypothetical protein